MAADENPATYWKANGTNAAITIDLGKECELAGFAYTPQTENSDGMMAKGILKTSSDGKSWKEAGRFEFGNLINDPTKRYYYLKDKVNARYVRIETTEVAAGNKSVAAAEVDLF